MAIAILGGLLAATLPAAAAQMGAGDEPDTSGALTLDSKRCTKREETNKKGEVVTVARSCLFFYTLDQEAETDTDRDYGVIWLQTTANAKPGWCFVEVRSDIEVPERGTLHARAPRSRSVSEPRVARTRLTVDARDQAPQPATVSQTYTLYPRSITRSYLDSARRLRLEWKGSSGAKLAFVLGAEISWDALETRPEAINSTLNYGYGRKDRC